MNGEAMEKMMLWMCFYLKMLSMLRKRKKWVPKKIFWVKLKKYNN